MAKKCWQAPPATQELLAQARQRWHGERLEGARIGCVFIEKGPRSGGVVRMGKAKKQGPVDALVGDCDFVIVLSHDVWKGLDDGQRTALLDHELCHCAPKVSAKGGRTGWRTRKHDLEEFAEVVERHGLVFPSQQRFAERAAQQLALPFDQPEVGQREEPALDGSVTMEVPAGTMWDGDAGAAEAAK